jgi:hypothetical protein
MWQVLRNFGAALSASEMLALFALREGARSSFSRMPSIARKLRSTQGEIAPCARHVVGHRDRDSIDAPILPRIRSQD